MAPIITLGKDTSDAFRGLIAKQRYRTRRSGEGRVWCKACAGGAETQWPRCGRLQKSRDPPAL